MSPYFFDGPRRYRSRRSQQRQVVSLIAVAILAALLGGYFTGKKHMLDKYRAVRGLMQEDRAANKSLESRLTELEGEIQARETELEQLRLQYEEEVPKGEVKDLMVLVNKKLARGLDANRLALVIDSARPPHGCSKTDTQPLLVVTPGYGGPQPTLDFTEEGLVITAEGHPALNAEEGREESWFDPAQTVSLSFVHSSGTKTQKSGLLPLQHSMVVGDREYRFSIGQGARSLIDISFNHCSYP